MNKFKYIFYSIVIIGCFLLGYQCGNSKNTPKNDLEAIRDTISIHTVDTLIDTLTVFKTKEKRVFVPEYEFIVIPPDSFTLAEFYKKRHYKDSYRDSNIQVQIEDTILGYLLHRKVNYRLFVPLRIYDSTKVQITTSYPKLPKYQFSIGIDATPKNIFIGADLNINRTIYSIGYDPINKAPKIGLKYTLWYSKRR